MKGTPYAHAHAQAQAQAYAHKHAHVHAHGHFFEEAGRFQDSIGYTLATEGPTTTMGAAGGLQIWPRLQAQSHSYQELNDSEGTHHNRVHSDSISSNETYTRRRPTLHAAASQPDLHSARRANIPKTDAGLPPPIPTLHQQRSQKLDFAKFFSRNRSKSKDKNAIKEQRQHDPYQEQFDLPPPPPVPSILRSRQGSAASTRPSSSSGSQRTEATVFDRNPTENAKIHVRRPPRGIKHWFDGLDHSEDDLPEVVIPVEPVSTATFRPSLGPGRSRVAPTSRVSPACEPVSGDYFRFQPSQHQPSNLQDRSMLNLSSDDDDESEPPSPSRWTEQSADANITTSVTLSRTKSRDTRQSTFSMQTTMTSGSIPIIHAENLSMAYRTPLPPLPAQYQSSFADSSAVPAPLRKHKPHNASPVSRTRAKRSSTSTTPTTVSETSTNANSHVMAVTQEEMALLEMMRRKRAEMQSQQSHPARRQDQNLSRRLSPFERNNSVAGSTASSTMSYASGQSLRLLLDSPDGTAFPAPPSARVITETENMNYFGFDDKSNKRSSEGSTPHSSMLAELEAPTEQLSSLCFSKPFSSRNKPDYNSADPYQLAPDLELSSIDLLPLPARTYSPSLTGTCSSAATPEFGKQGVAGFDVAESDQGSEGDRIRQSVKSMDSVDFDAFAAWGRLGGS